MTVFSSALLGILALAPAVRCIAFLGPKPTSVDDNAMTGTDGWSPKPTEGPKVDLLKREWMRPAKLSPRSIDTYDYDWCGWQDGIYGEDLGKLQSWDSPTDEFFRFVGVMRWLQHVHVLHTFRRRRNEGMLFYSWGVSGLRLGEHLHGIQGNPVLEL